MVPCPDTQQVNVPGLAFTPHGLMHKWTTAVRILKDTGVCNDARGVGVHFTTSPHFHPQLRIIDLIDFIRCAPDFRVCIWTSQNLLDDIHLLNIQCINQL